MLFDIGSQEALISQTPLEIAPIKIVPIILFILQSVITCSEKESQPYLAA